MRTNKRPSGVNAMDVGLVIPDAMATCVKPAGTAAAKAATCQSRSTTQYTVRKIIDISIDIADAGERKKTAEGTPP